MQQYHDLYLNLDVLLLADVFENFRQTCILDYDSTPHIIILYQASRSMRVSNLPNRNLVLFTDSEKFLFIENSIRGGISVVCHRNAKANNPLVLVYDYNTPHSYFTYLDANNLYG